MRTNSCLLDRKKEKERLSPQVKTLGGGGLTFVHTAALSVGTELQMRLHYYTDEIDLIGRVVWINKVENERETEFKCGLKYTAISEDNLARINHILNIHLGNPDKE